MKSHAELQLTNSSEPAVAFKAPEGNQLLPASPGEIFQNVRTPALNCTKPVRVTQVARISGSHLVQSLLNAVQLDKALSSLL